MTLSQEKKLYEKIESPEKKQLRRVIDLLHKNPIVAKRIIKQFENLGMIKKEGE